MYSLLDLLILLILGCGFCWLCVCLWFLVVVGSFFGGSFPPGGYLRVSLSPPLVFCCAGVGRLCWSWFFSVYKVLRLFSCLVHLFVFTIYLYFQIGPGLTLCGFPSLLHLLLFLSVGVSYVGWFPLPGGILVFPASTHSFFMVGLLWAVGVHAEPSLILTLPGSFRLSYL